MSPATEETTDQGVRLDKIESLLANIIERMPEPETKPEPEKDKVVDVVDKRLVNLRKAAVMSANHNQRFLDQMKQVGAGPKTMAIVCVLQSFPKLADGVIDLLVEGTKPIVDAIETAQEMSSENTK